MAVLTAWWDHLRGLARSNVSVLASVAFIAVTLSLTGIGGQWALAVYALSFWHYLLYWLAYRYGAIALGDFKRDAILMKLVSAAAIGAVYFAVPPDVISLVVSVAGFLLNAIAASVLGADRTYYGYEVADLPPEHITTFPYSWISHPMLVGNIAMFGGTLLNAEFRREWWPLACLHVALNAGLLLMERYVTPQRRRSRHFTAAEINPWRMLGIGCAWSAVGAAVGATALSGGTSSALTLLGAGIGACAAAYGYVLYRCYSVPALVPASQHDLQGEAIP